MQKVILPEAENQQVGSLLGLDKLALVADLKVEITVDIGGCTMRVEDLMKLREKSIVKLDTLVNTPVSIMLKDHCIARGELLVVEDNFGVQITEILQG